jgi:Trp operon repressor
VKWNTRLKSCTGNGTFELSYVQQQNQEQQQQVQWRRDKVQELCSKGYSQREISQILQVGVATVNMDINHCGSSRRFKIIEKS